MKAFVVFMKVWAAVNAALAVINLGFFVAERTYLNLVVGVSCAAAAGTNWFLYGGDRGRA